MRSAGIDIGSRTVKLAIVTDGQLTAACVRENSFDPLAVCRQLLAGEHYDAITATGYGRHLFTGHFGGSAVSELSATATAAHWLLPACRTVIDIGGQDTKAIALDAHGRLLRFEMNDKCAAGTGRFLEVISMALAVPLRQFSALAASARQSYSVNSTCAVFAESEVVSLIARGVERSEIARGIADSIALRTASLAQRIGLAGDVLFSGGVAFNHAVRDALATRLRVAVHIPENPQIVAAIGCALLGASAHRNLQQSRQSCAASA